MTAKKRRPWRWALLCLVLIGAGLALFFKLKPPETTLPAFTTAPLTQGEVSSWVTATGTVSPRVTVEVGSQISGRILELFADFNAQVTKGQLLARIDPLLFESEVSQARASVVSAEANIKGTEAQLANARLAYERTKALVAKKLVAQSEVDSALAQVRLLEAQLAANRAQLAQTKATLEMKQTNLAYTRIHSPIDGVVVSRDVDVGQTVAASMQAPTLFTIAEDLQKMEVHTSVAESDVGRVQKGMKVKFTVDAYPTTRFEGEVKEVRYSPTTEQNVVTYNAVVSVENPDLKLLPGMTADVSFLVAEEKDALLAPNTALRFKPSEALIQQAKALRDAEGRAARPPAGSRGQAKEGVGLAPPPDASADGVAQTPTGEASPTDAAARPPRPPTEEERKNMNFVWKLGTDGQPHPVRVEVGITDGKNTSIQGRGLRVGDEIVVSYAAAEQSGTAKATAKRGGIGFMGGPPPR